VEGEDAKAAYKVAFKLCQGNEIVIQLWVDNKGKRGNPCATGATMARAPRTQTVEVSLEVERDLADGSDTFAYELLVECKYYPGRPPPPCSDHDHPNFSDPGDGPELEVEKITVESIVDGEGENVALDDPRALKAEKIELTQSEEESLYDSAGSKCDDYDGPDPDEAYERWRDMRDERGL
jgi:hypothetical protein